MAQRRKKTLTCLISVKQPVYVHRGFISNGGRLISDLLENK